MPILKQQVDSSPNSLQILCLSSVSWKICPLYFFTSNNIYFAQKKPIKMKIFENFFECSGQHLSNFLCQFWNDKSIVLQILYLSSVSWKIIPLYFFSSNNTYFAQKEPIKVKMFETCECSGQILLNSLRQFRNSKSIFIQILSKFCVSLRFHERYVLYTILAQTIYTLLKRSPLKWKFLRISSSAQVKICQIFYVNFETTSQFLPKFCIPLQFHERLFLCTF